MQVQKVIEELGYTAKEAKVYLAATELGEAHISDIAVKVRLPRSSVQAVVDKLHKDGLMNFYVQRRYKYWVAEKPERLIEQLRKRQEMIEEILPELSRIKRTPADAAPKPVVKVFAGRDEIGHVLDDIIDTHQHIQAIIPEDAFIELFAGTSNFEDFTHARVRNFLRFRVLAPNTPVGRALSDRGSKELREIRFLPDRVRIKTASFMYGNKVAFLMFNEKQPTAVLIEDASITETKIAMFEELWAQSGGHTGSSVGPKEELFRVFADSSLQPVLITNQQIEIEYANTAWQKLFGYSLRDIKGKNPRVLGSGKTPPEVYVHMWEALRAGKMFQSDKIIDKRKDGGLFHMLTTIFPIQTGNELFYVQMLNEASPIQKETKASRTSKRIPHKQ